MNTLLMGAISLFIAFYLPPRLEEREFRAIVEKARTIADMTAFSVGPALLFNDRKTLEESFDAAKQDKDVAYVVAADTSGAILGGRDVPVARAADCLTAGEREGVTTDGTLYRVMTPVFFEKRVIGGVFLGMSLEELRADSGRTRSAVTVLCFVIFVLGTLSAIAIGTVITVPLRRMVGVVLEISRGNIKARAPVTSADEVGILAGAFNAMVDSLHATRAQLEEANRSLEQRVEDRTRKLKQEIADREKAEARLREQEEQFRLIADNVADLIALVDVNGRRVYNSPSYRAILGDPEQMRGSDSFNEIHPDDRERVKEAFAATVRTGTGSRLEYRFLLRDGSVRHIESQASVVKDAAGAVAFVVVVSRDVTEKKLLERQFLRAQRMESLGTLASGIAHDLNNVLSPIMMSIELIRTKLRDKSGSRVIDALESSAKRGSDIVRQVLAFGRGLAGERITLQPKYIIKEIAKIIQETFPKGVEFTKDIPGDLWTISADPTQMHQVILNVCVNARDAMPEGGKLSIAAENVTLSADEARTYNDASPGPYVAISIADTGMGIRPDILDKIFEPFFTTKDPRHGTGLGLSTSIGIVRAHGGFMHVHSRLGEGTTFVIYMPAQVDGHPGADPVDDAVAAGHGEMILAVDDEPAIRETLTETLGGIGYRVITACDGVEALDQFVRHRGEVRVVVTDMMMPVMDGRATIRALRGLSPGLRIIAMSGFMGVGDGANIAETGADRYIPKPFTTNELVKVINEMLEV